MPADILVIYRVWPDAVKMEAFARTERPGWIAWGNETERFAA